MAILRKRRWLSYSVRGLLVVVTLTALGFGAWRNWVRPYQRQSLAAAKLRELGAEVKTANGGPAWARRWFGNERFQEVVSVEFPPYQPSQDELARIAQRYIQSNPPDASTAGIADEIEGPLGPVRVEYLPELTTIIIRGKSTSFRAIDHPINDEDLRCLADLPRLETLRVPYSNVGNATVARLKCQNSLMVVDLGFSLLTDDGLAHLATFEKLRVLNLYRCSITDDGLKNISNCSSLEFLDLSNTFITDDGVEHLSTLGQLYSLNLSGTQVTSQSLGKLYALKIAELDVSETRITRGEMLNSSNVTPIAKPNKSDFEAAIREIQSQSGSSSRGQRGGGGNSPAPRP